MPIERESQALVTDLYQLTMAYGQWKLGLDDEAVFHLFFRSNPFHGGYAIACGLAAAADFVEHYRFTEDDTAYLATLTGADGLPLFEPGFLDHLRAMRLEVDVDAVPEGTVVFPHEPLLRVQGPLFQCQLLETALLNHLNFETLIATKASRVCQAAKGEPVLEFGLRRAQGPDGGLSASRAAYVGGAASTSNVLAGKRFGIPVRGTHAHSWVMAFDDELASFEAYAQALPNNCVFLVDTYDSLDGVRHAVEIGHRLRARGHELLGIRLDSGDLAYLSIEARKILDSGGFPKAVIVASNDLDEHVIASLKEQGAKIAVWGVGTRLVTGHDQPALGGVFKLSAVRRRGGEWQHRVKLSEQAAKISTPGVLGITRFEANGEFIGDVIHELGSTPGPGTTMIDPLDLTRRKTMPAGAASEELLTPLFRSGKRVAELPSASEARTRAQAQLAKLHAGVKRFLNPHQYPVGLEESLFERRLSLVLKAREARS